MTILKRFLQDDSGATAIEYGLIAAAISVVIITVVTNIGSKLLDKFNQIESAIS